MVRRSRTGHVVDMFAGRTQRHVARALALGRLSPGGLRARFWVADRSDSWSVLAFGAKWIISGRQRVRCGRPACITNAYLWHNLQLVHRLEDYRGTRIITWRHNRALTNILVHRLEIHTHALTMAHLTWVQTAGGTVRTARSTRGNTGTRAGPNGAIGRITCRLDPRVGPLHRETAWLGVGLRAD